VFAIRPIDVQAPNTVAAATAAIAAISLRLPRFALIAFLHEMVRVAPVEAGKLPGRQCNIPHCGASGVTLQAR
jgi:hypothetical protein